MSQVAPNQDPFAGLVDRLRAMHERMSRFPLMNLPWEIRLKIINFATEPLYQPVFLYSYDTPINITTELQRAGDRRLRLETLLVILEKTTLEMHSHYANWATQQWLAAIDLTLLDGDTSYESGFDAVRSLDFAFFSRFPHAALPSDAPNNDIGLARRCRNLRRLDICFADEACKVSAAPGLFRPKTVDEFRAEYRLEGILGLANLQVLVLKFIKTRYGKRIDLDVSEDNLEELAAWFLEVFGGRNVAVRVVTTFS